ncbi:MAG: PaaI family thioesterase [Myxococcota bacterium]
MSTDARDHEGPLDPYTFGEEQTCFGCGPHNDRGLRLRFQREGDTVTTRFVLGTGYDGPPGLLHGGLQALVVDEIAGWTLVGLRGRIGLTTSMNVRYIRGMRLGEEIVGVGRIVADADGMCTVRVTLTQGGDVGCMARASFAMADSEKMDEVLPDGLPAGWARFFEDETG